MSKSFDYNREHIDILLAQMMRSPSVVEATLSAQIEGQYLMDEEIGGVAAQSIAMRIIQRYYRRYNKTPDEPTLLADLNDFLDHFRDGRRREVVRKGVNRILAWEKVVDERSEPLVRKMISDIANVCVFRPAMQEVLEDASQSGTMTGLGQKFIELEAKQASVTGGRSFSGILSKNLEEVGERVATMIPWIDACTGGGAGPVNGSVIGIIAPQNGGKTTFGIQLAVSQALAGKHALLVLAEEGLTASMRYKIVGCALGIDYTKFEKKSISDVVADESGGSFSKRQQFRQKMAQIEEYLHVLDLVKENLVPEGIAPIIAEIEQMKSKGQKPSYVYVDWAGIIADAVVQSSGRTKEAEIQSISFGLAQTAYRTNCIIGISQQMSAETVKRGEFFTPDMYCAADCRMFTAPMKYAIAINKQDKRTGNSLLTWIKSRDDGILGDTMVVRLRGELAAFHDVSHKFEKRGKNFVTKYGKGSEGSVPSEDHKKREITHEV